MGQTSRHARRARWRSWDLRRILTVAVAAAGVAVLLYPSAATWFSGRNHADQVNAYVRQADSLPEETRQRMLAEARTYNANLPGGPLRDPYTLEPDGGRSAVGGGSQAYKEVLAGLPGGVMAHVQIPASGVDLPVFHGTDENTLASGVGHLFGSALPVGGTGTHSVLTTHSGLVDATLFTHLEKLAEGDVFSVTLLGERIESPPAAEKSDVALTSDAAEPGFPWWVLGVPAAAGAAILLTRRKRISSSNDASGFSTGDNSVGL
ncbi:MAG: sortase [Arthrobacter sp.]